MAIPLSDLPKNLKASQKDGNFAAFATGLTASYVTPFALALGAGNSLVALLNSFPDLLNSLCQLLSSFILKFAKSRRNIVASLALLQVFVWLAFLTIPFSGSMGMAILISLVAVNSVISGLIYPLWNSLMGDIVPANQRGYFFAHRTRLIGLCSFSAMLIAGAVLAYWKGGGAMAFASIFAAAGLARFFSSKYLMEMTDVPTDKSKQADLTLTAFSKKLVGGSTFGRFVVYASFLKFAVSIANPFFAVFLLKELQMSYLQFTIITAAPVVGRYLFAPLWGKFIDHRGNKIVLVVTGIGAPIVPILWLFNQSVPYLIAVELFSGFVWSGFDLSSSNYIFDAVKPRNRVKAVGYYNVLVGIGIFLGVALGGFVLPYLPQVFGSQYLSIFLLSGIVRILVVVPLLPRIQEARLIEVPMKGGGFFPLSIRPSESLDYTFIDVQAPEIVTRQSSHHEPGKKASGPTPDWAHSEVGKAILAYNREKGKPVYGRSDEEVLDLIQKGRLRIPSSIGHRPMRKRS